MILYLWLKMQEAIDAGKYQVEFGTHGNNLSANQKGNRTNWLDRFRI